MGAQILPLAITMMAGPQIMSAIVLVTSPRAVRASIAFLVGVFVSLVAGVTIARGLTALLGGALPAGADEHGPTSLGVIVQVLLVGLLVAASLKSYLGRKTAKPPAWLGTLMTATPNTALKTGALVILLMPSDIVIMLTVGVNLQHHHATLGAALPFMLATTLIAALPLLLYLVFHKRAVQVMPPVRDWMNTHSWLVNIILYAVFIGLVVSGG